jgi:hypothetical protein
MTLNRSEFLTRAGAAAGALALGRVARRGRRPVQRRYVGIRDGRPAYEVGSGRRRFEVD